MQRSVQKAIVKAPRLELMSTEAEENRMTRHSRAKLLHALYKTVATVQYPVVYALPESLDRRTPHSWVSLFLCIPIHFHLPRLVIHSCIHSLVRTPFHSFSSLTRLHPPPTMRRHFCAVRCFADEKRVRSASW